MSLCLRGECLEMRTKVIPIEFTLTSFFRVPLLDFPWLLLQSENGEETLSGRYSHQFFARSVLDCSAVAQPSRARELLYSLSLEVSTSSKLYSF